MCQLYETTQKDTSIDMLASAMTLPPNSALNNETCTAPTRMCSYISINPFSLNFDYPTNARGFICEFNYNICEFAWSKKDANAKLMDKS